MSVVAPPSKGKEGDLPADLFLETVPLDISTASFYELAGWTASLGLSTIGSAAELRARLYEHYGVAAPTSQSSKRTITIERAARAEYFKIESASSSIIRVEGGVILNLKDEDKGEAHRLEADEIVYDRDRDAVTARGHVKYRREKGSNIDEFSGETLSVNLEDWSGVFLDGRMRKANSGAAGTAAAAAATAAASGERGFAFQAQTLAKRSGDIILLDNSVISACDEASPHYSIRAKRLWLLGNNEWAIANAVLSLGEVPVLWLPFFYYPSEEIVFHPVLGYRTREGRFVQTSTYLIGQKPASKNTGLLSMIATDSGTAKQVRGLFLEPIAGGEKTPSASASLKLLGDIYSSLGAMVGIDGSFPKAGPFSDLKFALDLGASRSIFVVNSGYSPFVAAGDWASVWNDSHLLSLALPFRFMGNLSTSLKVGSLSASVAMPFYSDPYFEQDFFNRSEDMDWLGLNSSTTGSTAAAATTATTVAVRSSFTQTATLTYSLQPKALSPYISSIDLSRLSASIAWLSKSNSTLSSAPILAAVNPARTFFYPSIIKPVDASVTLRGSLIPKAKSEKAAETPSKTLESLRSPWASAKEGEADGKTADSKPMLDFKLSSRAPGFSVAAAATGGGPTVDWSLNPSTFVENRYREDSWKEPGEIDLADLLYSLASWRLASSLTAGYSWPGGLASASLAFSLSAQDQTRVIPDDVKTALTSLTSSYVLADAQFKQSKLISSLKLQAKPFANFWLFSPTTLSYGLDANIFQNLYNSTKSTAAGAPVYDNPTLWNSDTSTYTKYSDYTNMITANAAALTLGLKTGSRTQSLGLSVNILPTQTSWLPSLGLSLGAWGFQGDLSIKTRAFKNLDATEYSWDPLSSSLSLQAPLGFKLSDTFTWDFIAGQAKTNSTSLSWGPLSATLQAKRSLLYSPKIGSGWVATDTSEDFYASDFTAAFKKDWKSKPEDAVSATLSTGASYTQSLLRFSESVLSLNLALTMKITDVLDLTFTSLSQNSAAWRYWPGLFPAVEAVGGADRYYKAPIIDIWDSLSFWDEAARTASLFKLKSLSVKLVHYLHDWDLSFTLAASPKLDTTSKPYSYNLDPTFQFLVTWRDMSEIKASLNRVTTSTTATQHLAW